MPRLVPSRSVLRATAQLLVAGSLGACASVARPNLEPLVTDRPDFTESTETVPTGMVQVESGSTYTRAGDERSGSFGEVLARVGLAPRAELRIGLNSYSVAHAGSEKAQGLEDASLGAKFSFLDNGGEGSFKPAVSLLVGTSLPTGSQTFRSSKPQPEAKLALSWDLNSRVAFSSNLNYAVVNEDFGSYGERSATGSFGIGLTEKLGSYFEYFAFFPTTSSVSSTHYVNGGLTYGFTDNLQVDARAGVGVNRLGGPDYFFGVGIARRW